MTKHSIQDQITDLSLDEKIALQAWLSNAIATEQDQEVLEIPLKSGREVVEQKRIGRVTYQLELIKCGKPTCKCAGLFGAKHGPYWYSYQTKNNRLVSSYVGKHLM